MEKQILPSVIAQTVVSTTSTLDSCKAQFCREGVVVIGPLIDTADQQSVFEALLRARPHQGTSTSDYQSNPFSAFLHLYTTRWPHQSKQIIQQKREEEIKVQQIVEGVSERIHNALYGPNGAYASLPENGCTEDHQGRQCRCADTNPLIPRSTRLNVVEALVYRQGAKRDYHRDAHWLAGLTFGCDVIMGFQLHDHTSKHLTHNRFEVVVKCGSAVVFNGALHSHAVLGIVPGTAPTWWTHPFARAVFLLRDSRQSLKAAKRKEARRQATHLGAKQAAIKASVLTHSP